jgi:hypothetical protein
MFNKGSAATLPNRQPPAAASRDEQQPLWALGFVLIASGWVIALIYDAAVVISMTICYLHIDIDIGTFSVFRPL